jgi:hypothetical protein
MKMQRAGRLIRWYGFIGQLIVYYAVDFFEGFQLFVRNRVARALDPAEPACRNPARLIAGSLAMTIVSFSTWQRESLRC